MLIRFEIVSLCVGIAAQATFSMMFTESRMNSKSILSENIVMVPNQSLNAPRRALLISYFFPPSSAPGAIRWCRLVKDLLAHGWELTVVTTSHSYEIESLCDPSLLTEIPSNIKVYRTRSWEFFSEYPIPMTNDQWYQRFGYLETRQFWRRVARRVRRDSHRLLNRLSQQLIPDDKVGWVLPAYWLAKRLLREAHFDAVITSGMPHSTHLVGLMIHRLFPHIRWATYLGDPWSFCEYVQRPNWQMGRLALERQLESKVFHFADVNIVNTEQTRREYVRIMPQIAHKIVTVMNSCDPRILDGIEETKRDRFRFQYVGRFFGKRTPRYLLQAFRILLDRCPELRDQIEIRFTGNFGWDQTYNCWNSSYINEYELLSNVIIEPTVSHKEAMHRIVNSDALVIIGAPIESDNLYIPSKTFEYGASGRPILAMVAQNGATAEMINSLGCGIVVPVDDINEISRALEVLFEARLSSTYRTAPETFAASFYGPSANAAQFAACLESITQTKLKNP